MSLAIAHMMKKKKKCMAEGGDVKGVHREHTNGASHAGQDIRQAKIIRSETPRDASGEDLAKEYETRAKSSHKQIGKQMHEMKGHDRKYLAEGGMPEEDMMEETSSTMSPIAKGMKKAFKSPGYAHGGEVGVHRPISKRNPGTSDAGAHVPGSGYGSNIDTAKRIHKEKLQELHEMKGHDRKYLAEGGDVDEMASGYESMPCEKCGHVASHAVENQDENEDEDMIRQIMKQRKHYSEGGKVANETEPMADSEPAEYDDLVKDDDLEFHETAENSGDEDGDKEEDEDRHDVVSMIMKSRKKKDRLPHPA